MLLPACRASQHPLFDRLSLNSVVGWFAGDLFQNSPETLAQSLAILSNDAAPEDTALLRADLLFTRDDGATLLSDHTSVHDTCPSYREDAFTWFTNHHAVNSQLSLQCDPFLRESSPSVAVAQSSKHAKYRPMLDLLTIQHEYGHRTDLPTFKAPTFSHSGEFSSDLFSLLNWMRPQVEVKSRRVAHLIGMTPKEYHRKFREEALDTLVASVVRGLGLMHVAAGMPCFTAPPVRSSVT